eukprot:g46267.t1
MGVNITEDLQQVESQQVLLFASEASEVILQSRVCTLEQDETRSGQHVESETLREKERVDPVVWFPKQTVIIIRQNASSSELPKKYQDIAQLDVKMALPNKELTLTACCRLAHSKVQVYELKYALGQLLPRSSEDRLSEVFLLKENEGPFSYWTLLVPQVY